MKKLLTLLLLFPLFISCSSDDEKDSKEELEFIQIRVTNEDGTQPKGNVYMFRVDGYDITSDKPATGVIEYTPILFYKSNGESKNMIPISGSGTKSKGELFFSGSDDYASSTIFWDQLSSTYGTPKAGDEYLILVQLKSGEYTKAVKRLRISKNTLIEVEMPITDKTASYVDATWKISDYK